MIFNLGWVIGVWGAVGLLGGERAEGAERAGRKPNVILIYSDDHGYADLGVQGSVTDIRTPNLDALATDGVRFKRGYVSAPQCVPSRAGVLTGRYQERFGVEDNLKGPLPLAELTIAERLKPAGYVSCQVGKWHLEPPPASKLARRGVAAPEPIEAPKSGAFQPWTQGFDEYFTGPMNTFWASHDLQGHALADAPRQITDKRFRCVWQADAAISFIERHQREPFFLYLAFMTPHVPLESPEPWFSQTPPEAPLQRRQALAMIAAMDDGIGRLRDKLREAGLEKDTLIFFIGDNGAPLEENWDGSLNLPLVGEKGMLTDGGIRTPFLAAWPGTLPAGKVYEAPVLNLDVAATAVALAGLPPDARLDGVNLVPYLRGEQAGLPHEALYWRWRSQAAVRAEHWKLILLGKEERYLFDLDSPEGETRNRLAEFPEVAAGLEKKLMAWDAQLPPPGLPREAEPSDEHFYEEHALLTARRPKGGEWVARGASTEQKDGVLRVTPEGRQKAFLAFARLQVAGPAVVKVALRTEKGGRVGAAWRLEGEKDFASAAAVSAEVKGAGGFQEVTLVVPAKGKVIQLRVLLPEGVSEVRSVEVKPGGGGVGPLWDFGMP